MRRPPRTLAPIQGQMDNDQMDMDGNQGYQGQDDMDGGYQDDMDGMGQP